MSLKTMNFLSINHASKPSRVVQLILKMKNGPQSRLCGDAAREISATPVIACRWSPPSKKVSTKTAKMRHPPPPPNVFGTSEPCAHCGDADRKIPVSRSQISHPTVLNPITYNTRTRPSKLPSPLSPYLRYTYSYMLARRAILIAFAAALCLPVARADTAAQRALIER